MVQPASQSDSTPSTQGVTPLTAATPAGSGDSAVNAGIVSAAGAALPAPALLSSPAAPNNPGTASPQIAATAPPAPALLVKLSPASLTYKAQGSRFESLAAETLNNAGSSDDGFDDLINPVVAAFGEDQPALSSLQGDLADSSFVPGEFTATIHAPITADIADLLDAGDNALAGAASAVAGTPPPQIPTISMTGVVGGLGGITPTSAPTFGPGGANAGNVNPNRPPEEVPL